MEGVRKHAGAVPPNLETFVCEQNIALYRKLLEQRKNEGQRSTIAKLLSEEEAKLTKLSAQIATCTVTARHLGMEIFIGDGFDNPRPVIPNGVGVPPPRRANRPQMTGVGLHKGSHDG